MASEIMGVKWFPRRSGTGGFMRVQLETKTSEAIIVMILGTLLRMELRRRGAGAAASVLFDELLVEDRRTVSPEAEAEGDFREEMGFELVLVTKQEAKLTVAYAMPPENPAADGGQLLSQIFHDVVPPHRRLPVLALLKRAVR